MSHSQPAPLRTEEYNTRTPIRAEHWTGPVHWTMYRAVQRLAGTPTLLFVHGAGHNEQVWSLGPNNWVSHFTRLGYDCITLSLRGHKPSKGIVAIQTLRHYLQDAHAPAQALGLADAQTIYIGHSLGGIVVQSLLAKYPHIAGVVVVESPAPHRAAAQYGPYVWSLFRRHPFVALAAMFTPGALFWNKRIMQELLLGPDTAPALVDALHQTLGSETLAVMPEILRLKRQGLVPLPGHKLLFLGAEASAFYTRGDGEASAAEQPGAHYQMVPGAHNVMLTQSARQAAALIADFLATLPTTAEEQGEHQFEAAPGAASVPASSC